MNAGRLLALDSPSALKRQALTGLAWDVHVEPLLPGPSKISVRFVELDPHWDGLRDDPDFVALLERYR